MRNQKNNWIGTGRLSALAVAGMLVLGNGFVFAAQTKPVPPPPAKPAQLIKKPAVAPARPVPQPVRPPGQPARPVPQPVRPTSQPIRPATQPVRPETPPVKPGVKPETTKPETTRPETTRPETTRPEPVKPVTPVRTVTPEPPRPAARPTPVVDRRGAPVVPANAQRTKLPNGGEIIKSGDGREIKTNPQGKVVSVRTPSGAEAHFNNGRMTSLHKTEADGSITDIHRSPAGVTTIKTVSHEPGGITVRTVSDGHRGYRERDMQRRPGYKERTYFANGRTTVAVYHQQSYGRYGAYPVYVPAYTYSPGFTAWVGTPWGAGVSYNWGPAPAYGGYFVPAPVYASPNAWMADYMINQNLQANAAQQQDAQADAAAGGQQNPGVAADPQAGQPQPIPQDVRDTYAIEVQASIQKTQGGTQPPAGQDVPPPALDPQHTTFQSYSDVEATDGNGQECALTGGDFVRRQEAAPDASGTILVMVVAISRPSSSHCGMNAKVRISMEVLVDWSNSESEQLAAGEQALAENAGKNGLPPAPPSGQTPNPAGQAQPDVTSAIAGAIQQQQTGSSALVAEVGGGQ